MQPPWVFVASRAKMKAPTGKCEIDEWLTTYAIAEFKNGGEHAFYHCNFYAAKKDNLGPFRQTHVRVFSLLLRHVDLSQLTYIH